MDSEVVYTVCAKFQGKIKTWYASLRQSITRASLFDASQRTTSTKYDLFSTFICHVCFFPILSGPRRRRIDLNDQTLNRNGDVIANVAMCLSNEIIFSTFNWIKFTFIIVGSYIIRITLPLAAIDVYFGPFSFQICLCRKC